MISALKEKKAIDNYRILWYDNNEIQNTVRRLKPLKSTKRVIKEKTTVDKVTGEILSKETEFQFAKEPNYIKLYFDCLGVYISNDGLTASLNDMLVEVLKRSTYAEEGQTVYLNAYTKEQICKATGKSKRRIEQAITTWTDNKILIRVARGVYQVNPYIIGKGDWRNVSKLRATFDFGAGTVDMTREYQEQQNNAQTASESVTEAFKEPSCEDEEPLLFPEHEVAAAAAMTTDDIRQRYGL